MTISQKIVIEVDRDALETGSFYIDDELIKIAYEHHIDFEIDLTGVKTRHDQDIDRAKRKIAELNEKIEKLSEVKENAD